MSTGRDTGAQAGAWHPPAEFGQIWTVSELTERVRTRLNSDPRLQQVAVTGELTAFKVHSASGHLYFSLKDQASRVACVMFRSYASRLGFTPSDGSQVVATGYVDVYPAGGNYQLHVHGLFPVGLGLFHARMRELYARLQKEGLFDPARKRPLPSWPKGVGVVTSLDGAALRDIRAVFRRRSPSTPLFVAPAQVQGSEAVEAIIRALAILERWPEVDVILVARGGGSPDELWVFNDERLVRAVARAAKPVVCAVGHETDVTLAELAADRRASTPTAAAEIAGPDEVKALAQVAEWHGRMQRAAFRTVARARERWSSLRGRAVLSQPDRWLAARRQRVDELQGRLLSTLRLRVEERRLALVKASGALAARSPLEALARGYALVQHVETGRWVRSSLDARLGERLRVWMGDGALLCLVEGRSGGCLGHCDVRPGRTGDEGV